MWTKIKTQLSKGFWSTLATIIVLMVAGPEIMLGMELMAMVELLGASTFVLAYFYGFKLWLEKAGQSLRKFESHSVFFIPTLNTLKQMPEMILHAVPERILVMSFLAFVTCTMGYAYFDMFIRL